MPEPIDHMPEGEFEEDTEDYESPYPIDDRHLQDSIYRMCVSNNEAIQDMYGAYRLLKVTSSLIIFGVIAVTIGGILVLMLGGDSH